MIGFASESLSTLFPELHTKIGFNHLKPFITRLRYKAEHNFFHFPENYLALEEFSKFLLDAGLECWEPLKDPLGGEEKDDFVWATVDRYGFPVRIVFNQKTCIGRTDPYFKSIVLEVFYNRYYRKIYNLPFARSPERVFSKEVATGGAYFDIIQQRSFEGSSVLEIGTGMGGILLPFHVSGYRCVGIDYDIDAFRIGHQLGLNLQCLTPTTIPSIGKFDLVILSHVLEHVREPYKLLDHVKTCLSDGGIAIIEVPVIERIETKHGNDTFNYLQNAHAWYFSRNSFVKILAKAGFKILQSIGRHCVIVTPGNEETQSTEPFPPVTRKTLRKYERSFRFSKLKSQCGRILKL